MLRGIPPNETEQNLEKIIKIAQSKKIRDNFSRNVGPNIIWNRI